MRIQSDGKVVLHSSGFEDGVLASLGRNLSRYMPKHIEHPDESVAERARATVQRFEQIVRE